MILKLILIFGVITFLAWLMDDPMRTRRIIDRVKSIFSKKVK